MATAIPNDTPAGGPTRKGPVRDPRGALWRRWDLHVHTPASIAKTTFGGRDDAAWQRYFEALRKLPPEIRVLGINDYIFIDGYRKVREQWEAGNLANIDLVLPVVELRIDRFGGTESALKRVNYHVIFSDQVPFHAIEGQFLARLKATYRLNPDAPTVSWSGSPTIESLEDLGKRIIESVDPSKRSSYGSPLQEGFNNFNVSLDSVADALKSHYFEGQFVTAVGKTEWSAVKWLDGSIAEKKTLVNGADLVFISASSAEGALKARKDLEASGVNSRLLDCSDAHHYADSTEKDRLGNCFTWIRADPTFEGLRHVLKEFTDRVYIGEEPPLLKRVRLAPTKTIAGVSLRKKLGSALPEPWFDGVCLPVNPGMVAVIGNKGSGKSALLDILGLLGDSPRQADASFLSNARFRRAVDNKAREFEAMVRWAAADGAWRSLDENVAPSAVERVAYVPQSLFETICNELAAAGRGQFDLELKRVIFSHVRDELRLGHATLDDWVSHRTSELDADASKHRLRLGELNRRIVAAEERLRAEYRADLSARLALREAELTALDERRPAVVSAPSTTLTPDAATALAELQKLVTQREALDGELASEREREAASHARLVDLELLSARLERLAREVEATREATASTLKAAGLEFETLVEFKLTMAPLHKLEGELVLARDAARARTDDTSAGALPAKLRQLAESIAEAQARLDEPNRLFQEYQQAEAVWSAERSELLGDATTAGSLVYLRAQLAALEGLPAELKDLREARRDVAKEILVCHAKSAELLRSLYAPVQEFIERSEEARQTMKLSFYAAVQDIGFSERFLNRIHQGRAGSFAGKEDGEKRVRSLLASYDLDSIEGGLDFADAVLAQLRNDVRDAGRGQPVRIADQLRNSQTVEELYDFIFGFEYLKPRYGLRFGGRELLELSPGEKGALLLVFYLLVDRADIPLLIDQPEENLDNETIYSLLVPSVRRAKQRRQVIIVTHNPNLAVVCDADQVIVAAREAAGPTRISYTSGAIESPEINRRIVDILEGTRPAFNNRSGKYQ